MKFQLSILKFAIVGALLCISSKIQAQNTGPAAPEAMSFEPIDATDMVNLLSGDFSYVLPLIHVPGPGGGFSMPLSYHGGVAMDQEASWVGLGWSVNPGVINRSVNGFADDIKESNSKNVRTASLGEYTFYRLDFSISVEGISVGNSFAWGDYKSFGGHVGFGTADSFIGINASYSPTSGQIGLNASAVSKSSGVGIGLGTNGVSVIYGPASIGYNGKSLNGGVSIGPMDVSFSSKGMNVNIAGVGIGSPEMNAGSTKDIHVLRDESGINIWTPVFQFNYSKVKLSYKFCKKEYFKSYGLLYAGNAYRNIVENGNSYHTQDKSILMDAYTIADQYLYSDQDRNYNNFLAFDTYQVSGQGIAGQMSAKVLDGALINNQGLDLNFDGDDLIEYTRYTSNRGNEIKMQGDLFFSMDNLLEANTRVSFNENLNLTNLDQFDADYFTKQLSQNVVNNRRGGGTCVNYYTNRDIVENFNLLKSKGFIEADNFDRKNNVTQFVTFRPEEWSPLYIQNLDELYLDGIGAFDVTTPDGKTYHYSLPVYQYEFVNRKNDDTQDGFREVQNSGLYATSWRLTAITGPDYIDNGDGLVNDEDLGYWVKFSYGKKSDKYLWATPYDYGKYEEYIGDLNWGRKQLYYLNSVSTKTHAMYFVKEEREDGLSKDINYDYIEYERNSSHHRELQISNKEKCLSLSKTVLIRKNREGVQTNSLLVEDFESDSGLLCVDDIGDEELSKALQIINFNYDYSLCHNTPNSEAVNKGKLTLNSIYVKGKGGENILPPYLFEYHEYGDFHADLKDIWGYYKNDPKAWSLKSITTPLGAKIEVEYEEDTYNREVVRGETIKYELKNYSFNYNEINDSQINVNEVTIDLMGDINLYNAFNVGDRYDIDLKLGLHYLEHDDEWEGQGSYNVEEQSINFSSELLRISNNELTFRLNETYDIPTGSRYEFKGVQSEKIDEGYIVGKNTHYQGDGGGLRVATLNLINENGEKFKTKYNYHIPGTNETSGVTIYTPAEDDNKYCDFIPFRSELPMPGVIYEFVTVEDCGKEEESDLKTIYQFEVYDQVLRGSRYYNIGEQFQFEDVVGTKSSTDRKSVIKSNFATIGRLKSKTLQNNSGDVISKTVNTYKNLDEIDYGISQETFVSDKIYKKKEYGNWKENEYINTTSKVTYPSILEKVTNQQDGFTSEKTYLEWDKNSGAVTKSKNIAENGDIFISEVIPAYTKYPTMGSKILNLANKNMMSQETANYQYKVVNGEPKLLSAGIQTWEDDWMYRKPTIAGNYIDEPISGIWRKHKNFVLTAQRNGDGLIENNNWNDFNWFWNDEQNEANNWIKTNEITRYNAFSAPLESKDINGNYIATKFDKMGLNVIGSAANAQWSEITCSGFEEIEQVTNGWSVEGEIVLGANVLPLISSSLSNENEGYQWVNGIEAHTGKHFMKCSGSMEIANLNQLNIPGSKNFRVSCWVHKQSSPSVKFKIGFEPTGFKVMAFTSGGSKIRFGNWDLMVFDFQLPSTYASYDVISVQLEQSSSGAIAYVDDFRIHPLDASMNSYVYDTYTDELTAILDNENIATKYFYDEAGRLERVEKETPEGFKPVSEYKSYYANDLDIPVPVISNFSLSAQINESYFGGLRAKLNHSLNSTPSEYCVSIDDASFSNSSWRSYSSNITTTIPLGNHTVYFKVRNILSQESNVVSASINNYFDLGMNGSNFYSGDPIKGTCFFAEGATRGVDYQIYKDGNFVKTVYPSFTSGTSGAQTLKIEYLDGNSTEQNFSFSSSGLSVGEYSLRVIDQINNSFYKSSNFSIVSRPPSPSCSARYDEGTTTVSVSWSNFTCSDVKIYVNGSLLGTYSWTNGGGNEDIKVLPFLINTGGIGEPLLVEEPNRIDEPDGPSSPSGNNTVLVRCVNSSQDAESSILILHEAL